MRSFQKCLQDLSKEELDMVRDRILKMSLMRLVGELGYNSLAFARLRYSGNEIVERVLYGIRNLRLERDSLKAANTKLIRQLAEQSQVLSEHLAAVGKKEK